MEKSFQAGEITLSYGEGPTNGDPMVLLHGLTGWRHAWEDTVIAQYGPFWHQYAIDLRGHGKSSHATDENTYHIIDCVEDIVAFITSNIDQPTVIVGHSLGAMTAMGVGAQLGDAVRALVLLDPPLAMRELPITDLPDLNTGLTMLYSLISQNPPYEVILEACRQLEPEADENTVRQLATQYQCLDPRAVKLALESRGLGGFDFAEALEATTCPILLMPAQFGQSGLMRDKDVAFVAQHAHNLQTIKMPYDDHVFFMSQWNETEPHITAFLEAL
ncbi:MAG: alpha/beta hydrolase [Anaerolineaceae bacterium]|nr:alpha/beta hydrolase [Anaerolineaceae bacterium]